MPYFGILEASHFRCFSAEFRPGPLKINFNSLSNDLVDAR